MRHEDGGVAQEEPAVIVVKVELWPHGDSTRASTLGIATITNDGTAPDTMTGNYDVRLGKFGMTVNEIFKLKRNCWKSGRVTDFPRQRLGPWDLLFRALEPLVKDRNP